MLTTLSSGEEVFASFFAGFSEAFDFQVNQGDTVRVSVGETGDLLASPVLSVFDGSGSLVVSNSGNDDALVQLANATAGNYTAIVSESNDDEPMSFRIRAVTIPSSPQLIGGRDNVLDNGEEFQAVVPLGGFNIYRIAVNAGDTLRVSVGETGEFLAAPVLQLFDAAGQSLGSNSGNDDAEIQITSATAGTYTAIVSESNNDEAMSFRIRAATIPGSPLLIGGRDKVLVSGEETIASLPVGGFNLFRFEVNEGDAVRVSVGEMGDFLSSPVLQVFDAAGQSIETNSGNDDAEVQFLGATTGTYTAIVRESNNDEAMDFRIRAVTIPSSPVLIAGRDKALVSGEETTASLPIGGFSLFRFAVNVGNSIRVSVGEMGDLSAAPVLQLFNAAGQRLASDAGNDDAVVELIDATGGTYTAIVSESNNDEAMDFRIRAVTLPSDPTLIAGRDSVLGTGGEVESSIPIGGFNLHRFEVPENGWAQISVGETGDLSASPLLQVFDSLGRYVISNAGNDSAIARLTNAMAGTYTAIVSEHSNDEPMDYRIRTLSLPGTPAMIAGRDQNLLDGQSIQRVTPLGSFNVHRFDAGFGDQIRIEVEDQGSGTPFFEVVGPDGTSVITDSGSLAEADFEAADSGIFTIVVFDSNNDDPLEYQITLDGASGTFSPFRGAELFYDNSTFDQTGDDDAISGKIPLAIGQMSSFANFSSYASGINGVMIDIRELPNSEALDASDFTFRTGRTSDTSIWSPVTVSPDITVREGEGAGGSDRVVIAWPDRTIRNTWLEVTVNPTANTGLPEAKVFYFGNQVGDTDGDGLTNANDFQAIRSNPANFLNPEAVDSLFDINRDSRVDAIDLVLVRDHFTTLAEGLPAIKPQAGSNKRQGGDSFVGVGEFDLYRKSERSRPTKAVSLSSEPGEEELLADLAVLQEYFG